MAIKKKLICVKNDFDMNSVSSCLFHHSQWEDCKEEEHTSLPYLIYRILFMTILISSLTFSVLCQSELYHIFLTNWSFTLQTLYGLLFCFNILWKKRNYLAHSIRQKVQHIYSESTVKAYELKEATTWGNSVDINNAQYEDEKDAMTCVNIGTQATIRDEDQSTPTTVLTTDFAPRKSDEAVTNTYNNNSDDSPSGLEKVIWVLMNIVHVLPHIVVSGYWLFVYKYDPDQPACEKFKSHYIVHGATSVLALIDSLVVAVPARRSHFIFPSFLVLVYGLFSYIYEVAGGSYRGDKEYIYSILNWRYKPVKAFIFLMAGVVFSPIVHLITCWGFSFIRLKIASQIKTKS